MKIYIAGSWSAQKRLREMGDKLWAQGHEVVGSWLNEIAKPEHMPRHEFDKKIALKDLCEVSKAELVIVDTIDRSSTGGSDTEFGFALGSFQQKMVWTVGPMRSIFHNLADRHFADWEAVLRYAVHSEGTTNSSGCTVEGFIP